MNPLVLLGCGYIGSALAKAALEEGRSVHALVRTPEKAARLSASGFTTAIAGDVAGDEWHGGLPADGVDVVYSVSSGGGDEAAYRRAYEGGMASALRWAGRGRVRTWVYTSSTGVYLQSAGAVVDELSPAGGDARSDVLVAAERLLSAACERRPSCVDRAFVLRLGGLYGPGRHYLLDALRRGDCELPGSGDFRINYLHRDDAVSAIFAALNADARQAGGTYNITDGHPATKAEIVSFLAGRMGVPAPSFSPGFVSARAARRGAGSPDRVVASGAFRRDFGWSPSRPDFRSGYSELLD